jgi:hypothetical protein
VTLFPAHLLDENFADGDYQALEALLSGAAKSADYRSVLAKLGADLRHDGAWRATIKRAPNWKGAGTAWEALKKFIHDHCTNDAWWSILDYADGIYSNDDGFFEE